MNIDRDFADDMRDKHGRDDGHDVPAPAVDCVCGGRIRDNGTCTWGCSCPMPAFPRCAAIPREERPTMRLRGAA